MSAHSAKRTLSGTGQYIQIKVPNTKVKYGVIVAIAGTHVGTLAFESRTLDGSFGALASVTALAGGGAYAANAEGLYGDEIAAGQDEVRVYFSAYTSGTPEVAVTLVPDLD